MQCTAELLDQAAQAWEKRLPGMEQAGKEGKKSKTEASLGYRTRREGRGERRKGMGREEVEKEREELGEEEGRREQCWEQQLLLNNTFHCFAAMR